MSCEQASEQAQRWVLGGAGIVRFFSVLCMCELASSLQQLQMLLMLA